MDGKTAEIRYQQWVQVLQDWVSSGQTKREYCREKGIDEKRFYYYQHRIRSLLAQQAEQRALPGGESGIAPITPVAAQAGGHPQIVKLQIADMAPAGDSMISFSVNGMSLSVPENIPAAFLAKLLEAANHDTH